MAENGQGRLATDDPLPPGASEPLTAPAVEVRLRAAGRRLLIALSLSFLAVAPIFWATLRLSSASRSLKHTYEAIETLYSTRAALRQATAWLHAYLDSGSEELLAQYQAAVHTAWREAWHFKELTIDNPRQVASVPAFEQRLAEMLRFQDQLIAERRSGGLRPPVERVTIEAKFGDTIRDTSGALIDEERRLLAAREAEMAASISVLQLGSVALVTVLLAMAWFALASLQRVLGGSPRAES